MEFKQGEQLAEFRLDDGTIIRVGENCDKIIVRMQHGQLLVPWFDVWKDGKPISTWNAALCTDVLTHNN